MLFSFALIVVIRLRPTYWQSQYTIKVKNLNIRLSDKRLNKLRTIATEREKTITQLVEEWIDRLQTDKIG